MKRFVIVGRTVSSSVEPLTIVEGTSMEEVLGQLGAVEIQKDSQTRATFVLSDKSKAKNWKFRVADNERIVIRQEARP